MWQLKMSPEIIRYPLGDKIAPDWEPTLNIHWKDRCWSSSILATWWEELTHWKRPWCWERLRAGGEAGDGGWDGWMEWTWVWANSKRWWRTGKPGVLQSRGSQRVRHNWVTGQQQEPLPRLSPSIPVDTALQAATVNPSRPWNETHWTSRATASHRFGAS